MLVGIDVSRANRDKKTGVEWYAYHLIQNLKKIIPNNVRVVLYTDVPLKGDLAEMPLNWSEKVLKWPPKRLWTQIRMSWEMFWNRPDVLFIPAHVFPMIHPERTVMTIHDVAAMRFPETYNWFERWYSIWSARRALKKIWKIIVPTNFVKDELKDLKLYKEGLKKMRVVYHGYDRRYKVIKDRKAIDDVLFKYKIKKPFVMTLGRLEEKKNTRRIVKAYNKVRSKLTSHQLKLVLVGKPGHGFEKVKEVIDKSKFKEDIIRPGWVEEEDVPYLMNAAEVFVYPSLYEGFGIPVLEAGACATPVIASRGNSLEEVGGEVPIYVSAQDIDSIAGGIMKFLESPDFTREKMMKGLQRVSGFSWENCAKETWNILK